MLNLSTFLLKTINNITISVAPDKSISHRAVIFSSLARGVSTVSNVLESLDVNNTINTFKQLGVEFNFNKANLTINSPGYGNFIPTTNKLQLDMGNSGTSTRLLMGVLASNLFYNNNYALNTQFILSGDHSLNSRPMLRIVEPLNKMGAEINFMERDNYLPITIKPKQLNAIKISNISSAQVKSGLLIAGMFAQGDSVLGLANTSRNHTENILFELKVNIKHQDNSIYLQGTPKLILPAYNYVVPGDFSSASFFIALAVITPHAQITIKQVNINTTRSGLLTVLKKMHADITISNITQIQGEDIADITVKYSKLVGCSVDPEIVDLMIDEYPILAIIALFAKGKTVFNNVQELRYKESDRIQSIVNNFNKMGFKTQSTPQSLTIYGLDNLVDNTINNTCNVLDSFSDHRIAMSMLVLASRCTNRVTVLNCSNISTSFPNFLSVAKALNWHIEQADEQAA